MSQSNNVKLCECGCGLPAPIAKKTLSSRGQTKGQPLRFIPGHNMRVEDDEIEQIRAAYEAERLQRGVEWGECFCGCTAKTQKSKQTHLLRQHAPGQPYRYIKGHHKRLAPIEYIVENRGYETPCWVWQRALDHAGYGNYGSRNHSQRAHRVYYEQHVGPIPDDLILDHLCNVPPCVNPYHLDPTTQANNVRRGRTAKLTADDAREIRHLAANTSMTQAQIAAQFGVGADHVSRIVNNHQWRDID